MSEIFGLFDANPSQQRSSLTDLDDLGDELPDIDSIGLDDEFDDLDEDDDLDDDTIDAEFEEI
jgi:hypothetical protein